MRNLDGLQAENPAFYVGKNEKLSLLIQRHWLDMGFPTANSSELMPLSGCQYLQIIDGAMVTVKTVDDFELCDVGWFLNMKRCSATFVIKLPYGDAPTMKGIIDGLGKKDWDVSYFPWGLYDK